MTIDIPLSRNELIVSGTGVALGVAEILSPPVAVVVAVSPLLRRGVRALAGANGSASSTTQITASAGSNGRTRSSAPRRRQGSVATAGRRRRGAATA